jgi:cell surface protein SprA
MNVAAVVLFLLSWALLSLGLTRGRPRAEASSQVQAAGQSTDLSSSAPLSVVYSAIDDSVPTRSRRLDRLHRQVRGAAQDTSRFVRDSLGRLIDTTLAAPVDSSARIKQFTYKLTDQPQVPLFPRRIHPLFLRPTAAVYNREVSLDSTGTMVIIRETVGGQDVKVPLIVPLSDYIRLSFQMAERWGIEEAAHTYKMKEKKDELSELLGSVTNIDIPIPPNPILSLFGGRGINLKISGAVDIRAAMRNQQTEQATISALGNVRNEPDFNQDVQINVNGTVGDKLNINADWNTQRTFEYENQLKIKYTGYEDEIVQSVEAGNVSLSSPSSFIGSSQALFGFKAAFQMGPLKLTTIASQKKGQVREVTVTGGSQENTFELRAYQYSTSHYFLDTLYRSHFSDYYDHFTPIVDPSLQVVDIEVWVTRLGLEDPNERDVVAFIDLGPRPPDGYPASTRTVGEGVPGKIEVGRFVKLGRDQYTLHAQTGYITLNTNVQNEQAIAVAYRVENGPGTADDIFYGDFTNVVRDTSQRLVLKLVKPRNLDGNPSGDFTVAWNLRLKNIYPIGGRDIKREKFELGIFYQVAGAEPQDNIVQTNVLQMLGLDKTDESGTGPPDNKFDYREGLTIDPTRGEIIFPDLEPFREGIRKYFSAHSITVSPDSFVYADVYDTTVTGARNNNAKDRFIIRGKYASGVTSTYNLGFNIVDGSVDVLLNNARLTPNVDYVVDYSTGQLIIRNEAALVPGSNLQIRFEQNDLFQLASKTLLGARGDYQLAPRTNLGFTIMNLNQQTLSDKVRINEEPISNTIMGIDGSTVFDTDFLTSAINALPLINTRVPSNVTLRAEAAYMRPDPNTRKSPIPIDGGQGVAYIDDFEGIKRTIPLGTGYGAWHYSSVPRFVPGLDPSQSNPLPDSVKMWSKAKANWYNIIPSDVLVSQIWPLRTVASGQEQVTVLNVAYEPRTRGEYNFTMDRDATLLANPRRNWGGMMRLLSATANNLIDENINFIEIWMQVNGNATGGKMVIDLGQISEDVIPNGKLDTEDGIDGGPRTGVLRPGEDLGVDGLSDDQERIAHAAFIQKYPEYGSDPSGDNWNYAQGSLDFSQTNGTEGNSRSEIGRLPDTEDLNRNGIVDLVNSYFEYEVDLDTTGGIRQNPLIVGGGSQGWYQYRIPLIDFTRKIGNPSFSVVEFIRVWFTGLDQPIVVRIADFNLVGNQWQEKVKNDSTFSVTTVSVEDNPDYKSPPGVVRERDRTRPDQNILANEQAMAMIFHNIPDGDSREAIRYFSFRPLDVFNYKSMKMFVRGDPNLHFVDPSNYDVELFFRFGLDTLNYYEYREPVRPGNSNDPATFGWDPLNNVEINFSEITSVKQARDSLLGPSARYPVRDGPPGATYSVRGNPTLTQIRFISVGIENPLNKGTPFPISGQIWVNELRISGVDDAPGYAYRADAGIKLADVATIGVNVSKVDPTFHALDQRFGSRNTGINWGVNANVGVEKFLPSSWTGTTIPLSYSHSEGVNKPKYLPGTDVLVTEAAAREADRAAAKGATPEEAQAVANSVVTGSQTLRVSDSWAVPTARLQLPGDHWYVQHILNKFSLGWNYNKVTERSPVTESRQSWAWGGRLSYGLTFSPENYIAPFGGFLGDLPLLGMYKDLKIYFTPTNLSWAVGMQRSQSRERVRTQREEKPVVRSFTSDRSFSFLWKLTDGGLLNLSADYGLDVASSLVHLETDALGAQRSFSSILKDMFFGRKIVDFGIDYSYNQRVALTPRLKPPPILSLDRFLDFTASYRADYRWQNNLQQGVLGKSTSVVGQFTFGMNFRLKQLTDPWFAKESAAAPTSVPVTRGRVSQKSESEKAREKEEAERREREKKAEEERKRREEEEQRKAQEFVQPEEQQGEQPIAGEDEEEVKEKKQKEKEQKEKVDDSTRREEMKRKEKEEEQRKEQAEREEKQRREEEEARRKEEEELQDTTRGKGFLPLRDILRVLIKVPLLDYDNISVNFTQQNTSQNSGVRGWTGFNNFWGRVPFFQKSDVEDGPSRLYQLGLLSDPSATVTSFGLRKTFPFFGARTERGLRAPGGNLVDNFFQTNRLEFRTSRQIVEGLRIDLNWKIGWSYNRNQTLVSDSITGAVTVRSVITTGDIERSYFTFPEIFSISLFKNDINEVSQRFLTLKADPTDTRTDEEKLADAFENGFETFPFLKKVFGSFVPRANWSLRWDGLERLPFFKNFASRVSFEHAYVSTFNRRWRGNLGGGQITESERMMYGFSPLAGLTFGFNDFLKGNLASTFRYGNTTSYDLSTSSRNIVETFSRDVSLSVTFGRRGFAIPFFGVSLTNDIDMTFSYTLSRNTRKTYDVANLASGGIPLEALTRTVIEPRIKYVLSARVSASLFYRYTSVEPDQGASRIPGTKTNEGGLDIHIAIQ